MWQPLGDSPGKYTGMRRREKHSCGGHTLSTQGLVCHLLAREAAPSNGDPDALASCLDREVESRISLSLLARQLQLEEVLVGASAQSLAQSRKHRGFE